MTSKKFSFKIWRNLKTPKQLMTKTLLLMKNPKKKQPSMCTSYKKILMKSLMKSLSNQINPRARTRILKIMLQQKNLLLMLMSRLVLHKKTLSMRNQTNRLSTRDKVLAETEIIRSPSTSSMSLFSPRLSNHQSIINPLPIKILLPHQNILICF